VVSLDRFCVILLSNAAIVPPVFRLIGPWLYVILRSNAVIVCLAFGLTRSWQEAWEKVRLMCAHSIAFSCCQRILRAWPTSGSAVVSVLRCWIPFVYCCVLSIFFVDCFVVHCFSCSRQCACYTFARQFTAKQNLGVFLCKFAHLGLFFRIFISGFAFNLHAVLHFLNFFYQKHVGIVSPLNYPFWACFANLLLCFCKITWHHCFKP